MSLHTSLLRPSARLAVALVALVAVALAAGIAADASRASAQEEAHDGFAPEPHVFGVTTTLYTGTLDELAAHGAAIGLTSCFATVDGEFVGHVFGAPPFVSADFAAQFSAGLDEDALLCLHRAPEGGPGHPDDVATGDPPVDAIREAVLAGDVEALAQAAHLEPRPCGTGQIGSPACPEGVESGTPIEVFTFIVCHGDPRAPEDLEYFFASWLSPAPEGAEPAPLTAQFYAAFEVDAGLRLLFALENNEARWLDVRPDGSIDRAYRYCGVMSPGPLVEEEGVDEFIVPPPAR